jgi:hypothetical protein
MRTTAYARGWEATFPKAAQRAAYNKKLAEHNVPIRMTQAEFDSLREYSCSVPTGVVIGKRWKCDQHSYGRPKVGHRWWMGEYIAGPDLERDTYTTIWRPIEVVP